MQLTVQLTYSADQAHSRLTTINYSNSLKWVLREITTITLSQWVLIDVSMCHCSRSFQLQINRQKHPSFVLLRYYT